MILRAVLLGYLGLFIFGVSDNIRGPLYPEILKEFALNHTAGSLFFSLSSVASFIGSFLTQFMVGRWGNLTTLRVSMALLALGQILIGFSATYNQVLSSMVFFGLSLGVIGVVQNLLVIAGSKGEPRQQLLAGLHSMYGLSSFVGPMIVSVLYGITPSWRMGFWFCAALTILFIVSTFFGKDSVEIQIPPEMQADSRNLKPKTQQFYLGVLLGAYVLAEIMVSTRLSVFSQEVYGFSFEQGAYLTGAFFIGMFAGRFLFALIKPNVSLKFKLSASLALTLLMLLSGIYVHPLCLAIAGFTMAPFYPMTITAASKLFPVQMNSFTSIAVATSNLLVVFMHVAIGRLTDGMGMKTALLVGPSFILFSLILLFSFRYVFGAESERGIV